MVTRQPWLSSWLADLLRNFPPPGAQQGMRLNSGYRLVPLSPRKNDPPEVLLPGSVSLCLG